MRRRATSPSLGESPGSTGYGEAFAQEIDEVYQGPDHEDLMSVVDAVVAQGWSIRSARLSRAASGAAC